MTKKKRKIQKNFLCVLLFFTFSAPPARLLLNLSLLLTLSVSLFSCSFPQFSFFFFFFFFFFFCKSFTRADIHTQHTEGYIYIYTYIYGQERNPSPSSQSSVRGHARTNLSVVVDRETPPRSILSVARPIHASGLDGDRTEKRRDGTGGEV